MRSQRATCGGTENETSQTTQHQAKTCQAHGHRRSEKDRE